jgi:serpin B
MEADLSAETLAGWIGGLQAANDVKVWLPRFKVETEYKLNKPLQKLGMTDAFLNADFGGMVTGPSELFISLVAHKAFVDVNEEGTEAAAATGVVMSRKAAPVQEEPKIFRADRPFLFALRHEPTGTLLFLGRYSKPM